MSSRPGFILLHPSIHSSFFNRLRTLCLGLLIGLALAGCAAQIAYRDGKDLVEQDKVEEGLAKLKEAVALEPQGPEYKQAYLQTRDRAVFAYQERADQLMSEGKRDEAAKLYRRVLGIDPVNQRAKDGLNSVERDERHARLLKEGQTAFDKKDVASAQKKLSTVLAENPQNDASRPLQHAITEKISQAPLDTALSAAYKKPISIEFKDAALKNVFNVISRTSGLNFLFDKDVKLDQKTSIFLKNSTIEEAVNFTLLTNQLEQQTLNANTVLIYPNTVAKQKDYQEMIVRSFYLANVEAKTMANILKTLLKVKDVVVDDKLNILDIRDRPETILLAEKLIALHDIPEPEVMLEVEILEVSRNRLLDLGIQWPNSLTLTPLPSATGGTMTVNDLRGLNGASMGASIGPIILNARKEDGDTNLLANPRIRVRNHEKAKIHIGDRLPNITSTSTSTGFVSESINYVDVGLKLDVEPTIYLDNDVAIKITLEVSNVTDQIKTQSGTVAYQIGTRTASTLLRLKDGENQVLAGLINDADRRSSYKVPGLGEIPILGRLFGTTTNDNQKSEIVLSITPHLIRNLQRPDISQAEFRSGTESNFRSRPESTEGAQGQGNRPTVNPAPPGRPPLMQGAQTPVNQPMGNPNSRSMGNDQTSNASDIPAMGNAPAGILPVPIAMGTTPPELTGGSPPPQNPPQFQWQGPQQVKVGNTFTVQLMLQSGQPVTSVPMTIAYDNHALRFVNVQEGIFLKQGGAQTTFTSQVDNGQIQLTDTRSGSGGATALSGLARLNFVALAPAENSQIQLLSATPTGLAGSTISAPLPQPFTVTIQP